MAEPICEDEGLLQEWTPLTQLLQQIPLKAQRGLFSQNLSLTCLNVVSEFIALGTNLGFVYWYCRANGDLQRLRFENCHCSVTCVKIKLFADYMVAAGTDQGTVIVFQIPKIEQSTLERAKSKQKQIERFTVNDLHQAPVTSIEWDSNEIRLYSGDKTGCVVLTEIDLNLHISKSMELLNEQFEIVQLSHEQNFLLISTVYRSIICDRSDKWKVKQVGTKERKILGKFGATFCNFQHGSVIYASRPGHRLWLSNDNGVVQQTLIFKSAIQSNCSKIQLINPTVKKEPYDTSFGKVIQFGDNKLITYNPEILYVLHPGAVSVVSVLNSARKILDLSVNENEIFILEGERSLLRIGSLPDKYSLDLLYQPVSRRTSFNFDELAAKLKDTAVESIKKITKDLIPPNEQASPSSPPAVADEALELPPIVSLPANIMPTILTADSIEIHFSASNQNSALNQMNSEKTIFSTNELNSCSPFNHNWQEEIITRPLRKRRTKNLKQNHLNSTPLSESESDTTSNVSEERLVCGVANDHSLSDASAFSQSHSSFSVLKDISSLLPPSKNKGGNEDVMKTSDTKSQTSLDTCESVSERLLLSSEAFREEQEKTFARLANQSMFDSYNSERTDNMSISLNMTTSSSFSSKISENLQSPSFTSENSGVASRTKSADSQNTDSLENEARSKGVWNVWGSNHAEENSSLEEFRKSPSESSLSERLLKKQHSNSEGKSDSESSVVDEHELHPFENQKLKNNCNKSVEKFIDSNTALCSKTYQVKDSNECRSISECAETITNSQTCEHFNSEIQEAENKAEEESQTKEENKLQEYEAKLFLPAEPLSYGPPSGSSFLGSQPSSDLFSIQASCISSPLPQDCFDHWPQYKTPQKIKSLAVCKNYVVCTDSSKRVYYSHLRGLALSWILLDHKASLIRITSDGSAMWILHENTVSALNNFSSDSPITEKIVKVVSDVKTFAIDNINNEGIIVTSFGKLLSYGDVTKTLKESEIPCNFIVADVTCSGGVILAISNDFSVLCKLPEEEHFRVVKTEKPVTSLAFGPENLFWIIDETNNIFFSNDFLNEDPHWWQVQISDYVFRDSVGVIIDPRIYLKFLELKANIPTKSCLMAAMRIATNENSVWVFNQFDSFVCVNKTGFTGYKWNQVSSVKFLPSIQWQTLCAGGVSETIGRVWFLSLDGNIFCTTPDQSVFQSIPVPFNENMLCMTSSVDTLWVLMESGKIYSRLGLSCSNVSGTSWKEMKSPQIDNLRFVWVSCGCDVVWACDAHGRTFMAMGSPHNMSTLDPTWVEVEGRPKDVKFEKVFVGPQLYMVWAIDTNRNLYVREGIFPHYQIGTSWVCVCGMKAVHVTISATHVWALASNGIIYKRCGVSENNCFGDYWRSIPGNMKMISSTFTNELWGVNHENKILRLSYHLQVLKEKKINTENKENSEDDISWEIVK